MPHSLPLPSQAEKALLHFAGMLRFCWRYAAARAQHAACCMMINSGGGDAAGRPSCAHPAALAEAVARLKLEVTASLQWLSW